MIFIGIDPGLDGAIAAILPKGIQLEMTPIRSRIDGKRYYDREAMKFMINFPNPEKNVFAMLERQQAFPHQGLSSTFKTGEGFGIWQGLLTGLDIPHTIVPAKIWQGDVCPGKSGETKERSIKMAGILFPEVSLARSRRAKKPHNGKADALLMAEYARRIYKFHKATH